MNERIYELAKQADLIKFDTLPWNPDAVTPDQESYSKAMKFAVSIINECCDVVDAVKLGVSIELPPTIALDIAAKNVKAYFGVE